MLDVKVIKLYGESISDVSCHLVFCQLQSLKALYFCHGLPCHVSIFGLKLKTLCIRTYKNIQILFIQVTRNMVEEMRKQFLVLIDATNP